MSVKILKLDEVKSEKILGGSIKRMFNRDSANTKNMTFSVGVFSQGEGLKAHLHPESEEVYYVVKGKGTVYLGREEKSIKVEPNTALYIPSGIVHGVENTSEEKLIICFFVAPGKEKSVIL